jgi:hypothetical protein
MARILARALHHPKPEHRADLIAAMKRLAAAADGLAGLDEIGAFDDTEGGRLVAISVWASPEAMQAGMPVLGAALADVPFDQWESQPSSMAIMPEVA